MSRHKRSIAAAVVSVGITAVWLGMRIAPAAGMGAEGTPSPVGVTAVASNPDVDRLSPEAKRLYAAVRNPQPGELKWQQIPWLVDLQEGIRLAREEKRPLLLFVSGDDPLEKC